MKALAAIVSMLLCTTLLMAQAQPPSETADPKPERPAQPSLFPSGYLDHEALTARLKKLAGEHPGLIRVESLARTEGGRDVWLVAVGPAPADREPRPALLLVANLEADHLVGSQVALELIERLAAAAARDAELLALLRSHPVYLVPRLNPDGAERVLKAAVDFRTNLRRMDRDRDGRFNEDGPEDLNGDGLVTVMWARDAKATLIADKNDPRLLRKADPAHGERAEFSLYTEGTDNDGDGLINEDPVGGVNLNRNWPQRWTEFDLEAGYSPASEPEVHALIQFAIDHPEIAIVWSFALNDNLRTEPRKPESGLDDADLPFFAELVRVAGRYQGESGKAEAKDESHKEAKSEGEGKAKTTEPSPPEGGAPSAAPEKGQPKQGRGRFGRGGGRGGPPPAGKQARGGPPPVAPAGSPGGSSGPSLQATTDGALSEWAYAMFGAVGLSSRLWSEPRIGPEAQSKGAVPTDAEARWLFWNDHLMGGRAFAAFQPFDHPTLGKVEIGGWRPGVRLNPPSEELKAITDAQFSILKELLQKLPRLEVRDLKVEARGKGLYAVQASISNEGYLPTALAQGVRTRRSSPVLVRLQTGEAKILAGNALNRIESLAGSGARQEFRWLIAAPGSVHSITLEAAAPRAGKVRKSIDLP